MSVRVLGRTLICVAGWLMLEEADDLQIGRLHIRAVHFDGDLDAQRLSRKNIFLRRWRVGCACGGNQTRQREAQRKSFSFHNGSSFYADIRRLSWAQFAVSEPTEVRGEPSYTRIQRQRHTPQPVALATASAHRNAPGFSNLVAIRAKPGLL